MAKIATVGREKWRAQFNRRILNITSDSSGIKAVDGSTGEIIEGSELTSIKNFLNWHIKSRRDTSELPTLWTVNP